MAQLTSNNNTNSVGGSSYYGEEDSSDLRSGSRSGNHSGSSGQSYGGSSKPRAELLAAFNTKCEELARTESQLVQAKMQWATLELENENLLGKLKTKTSEVTTLEDSKSTLEDELVKTKQNMGEALNAAYEFERQNKELERLMEAVKKKKK